MCLVDDDRVVRTQVAIPLDLGQQDAVGHHLDQRVRADLIVEPHLEANSFTERAVELLGQPLGHAAGRDAARLGVADPATYPATELETDLRQLGGLARARLAGQDHHLVVADRGGDLGPSLADRQVLGVGDGRQRGTSALDRGLGVVHRALDRRHRAVACLRVPDLPEPHQATAQPLLVGQGETAEPGTHRLDHRSIVPARVRWSRPGFSDLAALSPGRLAAP